MIDSRREPSRTRAGRVERDFLRGLGQRFGATSSGNLSTRDLPKLSVRPSDGLRTRTLGSRGVNGGRRGGKGAGELGQTGTQPGGRFGAPIQAPGTTPSLQTPLSTGPEAAVATRAPSRFGLKSVGVVPPSAGGIGRSGTATGVSIGATFGSPAGYVSVGFGSGYGGYAYGSYGGYYGYPYYDCSYPYYSSYYSSPFCYGYSSYGYHSHARRIYRPYCYRYRPYCFPYYAFAYYPGYYSYWCADDYYDHYTFYYGVRTRSVENEKDEAELTAGEALFCDGWQQLRRGEFVAAATSFAESSQKLGRSGLASFYSGVALAGAGRYDVAALAFEAAIGEHPSLVTYEWNSAEHLGSNTDALLADLAAAARVAPAETSRWVCLAAIAKMSGRTDDARRAAGEAIFSGNESPYAEAVLAEITRVDEGESLDPLSASNLAVAKWLARPSCEAIPSMGLTQPVTY